MPTPLANAWNRPRSTIHAPLYDQVAGLDVTHREPSLFGGPFQIAAARLRGTVAFEGRASEAGA